MKKSQIQGDLWSRSPEGWAKIQEPKHQPLWEAMLNALKVTEGTVLLDAGCGSGGASALAHEKGAVVYGIDVSGGLINFARRNVPKGKFQVGDIEEMPYDNNTFDAVLASNSLQYAEDRLATLREFSRVCKPGGRMAAGLFGSPEKVDFRVIFEALGKAMPEPPKGGGPFELSMDTKLEDLFKAAGFKDILSAEVNCPFEYEDFETLWYGNAAAGPLQGMMEKVGEEKLRSQLKTVVAPFEKENGNIRFDTNIFKYVVGTNFKG